MMWAMGQGFSAEMSVVPTQVSGTLGHFIGSVCSSYADRASEAWRTQILMMPVDPHAVGFPRTQRPWVESLGFSQVSLLLKHQILHISQGHSRG